MSTGNLALSIDAEGKSTGVVSESPSYMLNWASWAIIVFCFLAAVSWPLFMLHMGMYIPVIDNDEIFYIAQARTFSEHGFYGGLFSLGGALPRLPTYFGPHGPPYPIALGSFGLLAGWHPWTPYAFNVIVMVGSLAYYFFVVKSSFVRLGSLALLGMGSYLWFLPSAMQESLQASLAVLVAGILVKISQTRSKKILLLSIVAISLIATFRYLWAIAVLYPIWKLVTIPLGFPGKRGWLARVNLIVAMILSILLTSATIFGVIKLLTQFTSYGLYKTIVAFDLDFINRSLSRTVTNVQNLFVVNLSVHGFSYLSVALRIMYVAVFVSALYFAAKAVYVRCKRAHLCSHADELVFVSLYLLGTSLLLQVGFYTIDGFRDYRVLSHMWLAGGLCMLSSPLVQTSWRLLAGYKKAAIVLTCFVLIFLNSRVGIESVRNIYKVNVDAEKVKIVKRSIDTLVSTATKDLTLVRDDTLCKTILITALRNTYEPSLSWWQGAPGLTYIDFDWIKKKKDYGLVLLSPAIEQFPQERAGDYIKVATGRPDLEVYANKNCFALRS